MRVYSCTRRYRYLHIYRIQSRSTRTVTGPPDCMPAACVTPRTLRSTAVHGIALLRLVASIAPGGVAERRSIGGVETSSNKPRRGNDSGGFETLSRAG
jgi:hypothetical protein